MLLKPETQSFVTVKTYQHGLIAVEPNRKLFDSNMYLVGTGVAQVTPNTDFRILVANMGIYPKTLTVVQTISVTTEHPTAMMEAPITHGKALGVAV